MTKKLLYIILAQFCFGSYIAYSQSNCETPLPPVLTLVSVQPQTGITILNWTLSPSSGIDAYVIYKKDNGIWLSVDTLWEQSASSYVYPIESKYNSASFVVAAFRLPIIAGMDGCVSPLSNELNTVFATSEIDTCNNKIIVSWNSYSSVPYNVTGYSILASVNGGSFTEIAGLSSELNSYTVNDFEIDAEYCFIVRANIEGGKSSTSKKTCLSTKMQRPPLWINADYATVNEDKKIYTSFTIDPVSEITHFRLERRSGLSDNFKVLAQLESINGNVVYTDANADPDTVYYYRLSALNNCNIPIKTSNTASNIVLLLERTGNDLKLTWNSYRDWLGNIASYRLFINTGNGFEEKELLPATDTTFTVGYKEIMYEVAGNEVCFYLVAAETSNPYGVAGQSTSSHVCSVPTEVITVPNVFTPNKDLLNDLFKPVLSFTPVDYHLVISDRKGNILFESRDYNAACDGSQNGDPYPLGVCLWFLKVTTPSGKSITKTGTITVITN
jgi:gliding motility-associated-like protein